MASSDRYLRQAAIACMGWVEKTGQPRATLWDMWTLLLPSADDFRKEVVRAIETEVELAAACMFFGEQLPVQLQQARGQFVPRLDSPVNKLQKLTGQPKLDAILRHPRRALDRRGDPKPRRARRLRRGRVLRRGLGPGAAPVHPPHGPPRADPPAGAARARARPARAQGRRGPPALLAHLRAHARDGPLGRARVHGRLAVARARSRTATCAPRSSTCCVTTSSSPSAPTTRASSRTCSRPSTPT